MKIRVYTLFDITKTNVRTRRHDFGPTDAVAIRQRSQQSNFETVLQIIGIRSQPEDITEPEKMMKLVNSDLWGTNYSGDSRIPIWTFDFVVGHTDVFATTDNSLGKLLQDCQGIPMIIGLEESKKLENVMSVLPHNRNINFEILHD